MKQVLPWRPFELDDCPSWFYFKRSNPCGRLLGIVNDTRYFPHPRVVAFIHELATVVLPQTKQSVGVVGQDFQAFFVRSAAESQHFFQLTPFIGTGSAPVQEEAAKSAKNKRFAFFLATERVVFGGKRSSLCRLK